MAQEPGSNLPAPYVNPWSLLLRDLKAVGASLVLSLREGWRRNREGSLPRPPFWPEALKSLFWPLLLLLLLALPTAWALVFSNSDGAAAGGPGGSQVARPDMPLPPASLQPGPERPLARGAEADALSEPSATPSGALAAKPVAAPAPEPTPSPAAPSSAPMAAPPSALAREDRLLAELMRPEADGLLLSVVEDAGRLCLVLHLDPSFRSLPLARQERLAALWQEQAQSLGYEQLALQDPAGEWLGRSASVGSGMILFTMAAGG